MLATVPTALAEKRIALLIGNEAYTTEIGKLANPHNAVALLEQTFRGLGFEVVTVRDVGLGGLTRAVTDAAPTGCPPGLCARVIEYFPRRVLSSLADTHRRTIVPELL
jgi:hypothetical protein